MIFTIEAINYAQWKIAIESLKKDRKWLIFLPDVKDIEFYTIQLYENDEIFHVGSGYFKKLDNVIDWSFCIYPKFQRKGFARNFILHLLATTQNPRFTVSQFNNASMRLFSSIEVLKAIRFDKRFNTIIFM